MKSQVSISSLRKKPLMQANVLTQARDGLTRDQRRIFYLCLDHIAVTGWPSDGVFTIDHSLYSTVYKLSEKEAREDIRRAMAEFRGRELTLYESWDDGESEPVIRDIAWTTSRWRSEKRGLYRLKINSDLREFMEPLANELPFTAWQLEQVAAMPSRYSQKLFEALSQFRSTGFWAVNLSVLKQRWDLPDSYEKFSLLKARVIDPAMSDVKKMNGFETLTLTLRREGNAKTGKVTSIAFSFTPQERA
ncbi:RepB family plasmid replication initiator protein [Dickeya dadantii]|nr:RepB family plasmid replication initiator protein [Dickeya dadantii]NPE68969.1 RepB family plasmid replication initiator protein [Dickeya dadantii]